MPLSMSTRITTNRLRQCRVAQGIKQVELAALSGVSIATVNKCERWGFRLTPPVAERLAKALGCKSTELFPDAGR